jgi:hypothetical protein
MVKRCFWTKTKLEETFVIDNKRTIEKAEDNFERKSPSMLAASYKSTEIKEMIPPHLTPSQKDLLSSVLQKYKSLLQGSWV